MMQRLMVCFFCTIGILNGYGQELKQTTYYMNADNVSQIAKDIHSGKVQASDDAQVYSIADSMNTENNDTRPFYIFLVSKMLLNTRDRKLKLHLGEYCRYFLQNKPDAAVLLLFSKTVKPDYKFAWAKAIAVDINANCESNLKNCFKTSRVLALERCSISNKDKLEIIYSQIRQDLHLANH